MSLDLTKPDDRLQIHFREEPKELFMSFLRLNACLRILGEPERLATLMLDPDTVEAVLKAVLADKAADAWEMVLTDEDLTGDDVDTILIWVRDHLSYFFMKRFQQLGDQAKTLGPAAEALQLSMLGSGSSTSSEPPAGPSI